MAILTLGIPQNPLPFNRKCFTNSNEMDLHSMILVELPTDPMAEKGLPPHVVMELCFARFQEPYKQGPLDRKCWRTYHLVYDI